jgi:hypothetical protein
MNEYERGVNLDLLEQVEGRTKLEDENLLGEGCLSHLLILLFFILFIGGMCLVLG